MYTAKEFIADYAALSEVYQQPSEWNVPSKQFPIAVDTEVAPKGMLEIMNSLRHFCDKYGMEDGPDYQTRFVAVLQFVFQHRRSLARHRLTQSDSDTATGIRTDFLEFLLAGYNMRIPPVMFARHRDALGDGTISLSKTMHRWKQQNKNSLAK